MILQVQSLKNRIKVIKSWDSNLVGEHLPSIQEALGSVPKAIKKRPSMNFHLTPIRMLTIKRRKLRMVYVGEDVAALGVWGTVVQV